MPPAWPGPGVTARIISTPSPLTVEKRPASTRKLMLEGYVEEQDFTELALRAQGELLRQCQQIRAQMPHRLAVWLLQAPGEQ
eukprot:2370300-Prorocentrum_lima.AAC.1